MEQDVGHNMTVNINVSIDNSELKLHDIKIIQVRYRNKLLKFIMTKESYDEFIHGNEEFVSVDYILEEKGFLKKSNNTILKCKLYLGSTLVFGNNVYTFESITEDNDILTINMSKHKV